MYNHLKFLKLDFDTSSFDQATYKQITMSWPVSVGSRSDSAIFFVS